jgi:hypothetical protein
MKTFEEIIAQEPVFLHDWSNKEGVRDDFEDREYDFARDKYITKSEVPESANILFASYGQANYSGDAFVIFEENGKLYEVSGSHCSCYGLEGQWSQEEVELKELEHRLLNGTFGEDDYSDNSFKPELCMFLGVEYKVNTSSF